MHSKRNSITIGILWLILMVFGIFWYSKENKKINELEIKNTELRKKLDGSIEIMNTLETVESEYRLLMERWSLAPKQIVAADEPSFCLYYLNWLVNNYKIPLEFDFELKDIRNEGDILTFNFLLKGEGTYYDLYRLIWFITEHLLLYQIESFSVKQMPDKINLIGFSMQLKGFSLNQKYDSGQQFNFDTMKPIVERIQFHDAFKSLNQFQQPKKRANSYRRNVPKIRPKTIDPGLLNVEAAALQAVANGRVYIKNNKGKLLTLKVGDKVRSGRLKSINQKKSEVEFILEKQGDIKTVILGLGYKK